MVPLTQESRATDSRSSPREESPGSGRPDVGACPVRMPLIPGRSPPRICALSHRPRAAVANQGAEPPHDHEEVTLPEATAVTPGRVGAALSRNAGELALSRIVERIPALPGGEHTQGFSAYPLEKVYSRPRSALADGAEGVPLRHLACSVDGTSERCPAERTLAEPASVPASCGCLMGSQRI